jgi:hypothetical protein
MTMTIWTVAPLQIELQEATWVESGRESIPHLELPLGTKLRLRLRLRLRVHLQTEISKRNAHVGKRGGGRREQLHQQRLSSQKTNTRPRRSRRSKMARLYHTQS